MTVAKGGPLFLSGKSYFQDTNAKRTSFFLFNAALNVMYSTCCSQSITETQAYFNDYLLQVKQAFVLLLFTSPKCNC